jgi:hypothetical protein
MCSNSYKQTSYPGAVIDMELARKISKNMEAADRRGDLFNKRRQLMEAWTDYCGSKASP